MGLTQISMEDFRAKFDAAREEKEAAMRDEAGGRGPAESDPATLVQGSLESSGRFLGDIGGSSVGPSPGPSTGPSTGPSPGPSPDSPDDSTGLGMILMSISSSSCSVILLVVLFVMMKK